MPRNVMAGLVAGIALLMLLEGLATVALGVLAWGDGRPRHRPIAVDPAVGYGYDRRDYLESPNTRDAVGPSRFYSLRRHGPPPAAGERPLTILALGGSTTDPILQVKYSGTGGDWPHQLGRRLAESGRAVEIANAGMVGNLTAQELGRLVAVLPESRADVVISLCGINEIYVADRDWYRDPDNRCAPKFLLAALADVPSGGGIHHGDLTLRSAAPLHWLRGTAVERLVRRLRRGRDDREDEAAPADPRAIESLRAAAVLSDDRRARLVQAADGWLVHERMMQAICREFGARLLVVLQPAMGVNGSREELFAAWRRSVDAGAPDPVLHALLARPGALESLAHLYGLLRERGRTLDGFHDASLPGVVPDTADYYHSPRYPNAKGNARIAEAILGML